MAQESRQDPEKEKYWRKLFARFKASQLPFRKFCLQENVSPNTFQFWRKELRRRDDERGIASTISKGENRPCQIAEKTAFWKQILIDLKNHQGSENSFCRARGISSASLYTWRKRLNEMSLLENSKKKREVAHKPEFVPVLLVDNTASALNLEYSQSILASTQNQIDITLIDGTKIAAPTNMSVDVLVKIVNGLRYQ